MKTTILLLIAILYSALSLIAQTTTLTSPDKKISLSIVNGDELSYSVMFNGKVIVEPSLMGFEFKAEEDFKSGLIIIAQKTEAVNEIWKPIVSSKHSVIANNYNALVLRLKEKSGLMREMELYVRAYNDGIAFQYKLFRGAIAGSRFITKELTQFAIPGDPKAWIVQYGGYASSNEAEFKGMNLSALTEKSIAGMPLLMDCGNNCWMAITEAKIDNYPGAYLGTTGKSNLLTCKLAPLPGETETGVKVSFRDEVTSPWRVLMIGENPGVLIESEIIQNLNDPCAIADPSWIKPGMSAWDHWWSGEVKMEMPVIKQYIDMAAEMAWEYMLVDWQWYGTFNSPEADITKWAPQISMPEIIEYAAARNVKIIVWLYNKDVNLNSAYKKAFPLYHKWGIAGVKIDFMDREDQEMVNWYHDIISCAAENKLLVDFHGAYKPDGIIRTWPNMITREGVMGNEYYKFSDNMNPEHNVKLAFTRMLAGQMDYTPGGFLNVTREQFKQQTPALVWNTRAAELSKFVIYESPLTVVCDHPSNILGQPGADFLKIVPTVWDDTKFLAGHPDEYVALARKSGDAWFVGAMNTSIAKTIVLDLSFLPEGNYEIQTWSDSKKSDVEPTSISTKTHKFKKEEKLNIQLAKNGGFVACIRKK